MTVRMVTCPTCGKPVEWTEQNSCRPFCSERCRIIDLGDWASEKHKIPSETADDFINPDDSENS